jgi:hypothetical protein
VVNLILYNSATETHAKLDFLYEIRGTLDPYVRARSEPGSLPERIGGKRREVSASGIEEATAVGIGIAQEGLSGVGKFVRGGGYKRYTDGLPESLNFVVFTLVAALIATSIKGVLLREDKSEVADAIGCYLENIEWLVERKISPTHNPIKDVELHAEIFKYSEYSVGIVGLVGCAVYPGHVINGGQKAVGALNYGNTCPLNAAAQFIATAPHLLWEGLQEHSDAGDRQATARRALNIAATNLLYGPLIPTSDTINQGVAISQYDIAFAGNYDYRLQQDAAELVAMYMSSWGPSARKLVEVTRKKTRETIEASQEGERVRSTAPRRVDSLREFQVNVPPPVEDRGQFDIISAMNPQHPEEIVENGKPAMQLVSEVELNQYSFVCLNRFSAGDTAVTKNHTPAAAPLLMRKTQGYWCAQQNLDGDGMSLRAAMLHDGEYESGHFCTYGQRGGRWWSLSDEHVEMIQDDQRDQDLAQFGYLFLYQRR